MLRLNAFETPTHRAVGKNSYERTAKKILIKTPGNYL